MKKFLAILLIIAISPVLGGVYGIIHDQLTYTISHEYYTKFKFYQFGLMDMGREAIFPNPRIQVSEVGYLATWWMGVPIGIILGFVGLIHKSDRQMLIVTFKAFLVVIIIAFITGLTGLAYGKLYLANSGVDWWLPENLIDMNNYIAVGSMHNFSYVGGIIGLIGGVIYSLRKKKQLNAEQRSADI